MFAKIRHPRGFTLLEVLIAFAIVAISLAALVRAAGFGVAAVHQSDRYEEALSRARSHLATLAGGIDRLPAAADGDDGGGYRWHLGLRPFIVAQPIVTEGPPPAATPTLYAAIVTISWNDGGTERSVSLTGERLGLLP